MSVECDHCSLPVPAGLVEADADLQFCCNGCRVACEVIHEHGLDGYYDIKSRIEAPVQAAQSSGRGFAAFDDPAFHRLYCRALPFGLATVELYLEGVHCAACVWLVEKMTVVVDGVAEVRLDLGRSLATVTWNPETTPLSQVAHFLDSIGYAPHPFRGVEARDMARREERALLIRIAVAGAIAGNVMLIAFALYGGRFHGITDEFRILFRWASLALAIPSVVWCASVFYRGAWGALKTRTLHMDLPIAIGILAGFIQGAVNTVRGTGEIYFDSVTALIFFLLVGRFLQRRQQRRAASSTELLFSIAPATARLVDSDGVREVPLEALSPGNTVEVRAGDSIPADGSVVEGISTLDRSLLTGESLPEPVAIGDPVHAGTVNLGGRLLVEVRVTGEDTRVGRLMRLVEEGAMRRAPVVLLADRISGWFVAIVLTLAAITLGVWLKLDPEHAVGHAVALLIVSCPCALGLATPLAVSAAIGRAARKKILIKGGDALENLARPGRMFLDKTGTLTEGRLGVLRWWGDASVRPMVAAIERHSAHPVARSRWRSMNRLWRLPESATRCATTAQNRWLLSATVGGRSRSSPAITRQWSGPSQTRSVSRGPPRVARRPPRTSWMQCARPQRMRRSQWSATASTTPRRWPQRQSGSGSTVEPRRPWPPPMCISVGPVSSRCSTSFAVPAAPSA
jgi:Cu2+-exporting ATPase